MALVSVQFLLFFFLSLILYYLIPLKYQWIGLLVFSLCFYLLSATPQTLVYLVVSILVTAFTVKRIAFCKTAQKDTQAKIMLAIGIVVNLGILAVLKYSNFFALNISRLCSLFGFELTIPEVSLAAPLGISFYTMQVLGYLLDSYWGIATPQKGVLKTALFVGYFPQLTSGPIARYQQVSDQLYSGHKFDYETVVFGVWRLLWGFFKKLVLSARIAVIVDTIYNDPVTYAGLYIWLAAALFMLQLYTDFSGCMDIILGVSECYGIRLPENFRTPFFSRSIQEFWQRWHITLGAWLKDYILYPILRTNAWRRMTQWIKAHWGKKAAKQIPAYLGMFCVWLLIGLWHGGNWKYVFGQGIWFWLLIVLSQVLSPCFKKVISLLRINTDCFSWHLFQSLRVFCLVCIGNMFFRLEGLTATLRTMKQGLACWNPEIFFDGSLFQLGLDQKNVYLMAVGLGVLLLVSVLQEKGSVREMLARQNIVFRWGVLFALIFGIIIFGMYGPGYDAQSFIYEQF